MPTKDKPISWDQRLEGAFVKGTPIVKVATELGDANSIGTKGIVLGSAGDPAGGPIFYFVEWETFPGIPVVVVAWKIQKQAL